MRSPVNVVCCSMKGSLKIYNGTITSGIDGHEKQRKVNHF